MYLKKNDEMKAVRLLSKELRDIADRLDAGNTNVTEEDALEIFSMICNVSVSKSVAAKHLNMPVATFDKKVKKGEIPPSHKHKGITERLWYLKDIFLSIKD